MCTFRESFKKNCEAFQIFILKGSFKVIRLNSPPNAGIPSIACLTDGCLGSP